jgi:hypothetical protein
MRWHVLGNYFCPRNVKSEYSKEKTKKWLEYTDEVIEVKDKNGKIVYYLVDRYDRDGDYQLKLQNRQFTSYASRGFEYGPIIIPIKYRFERKRNGIAARDEFQADLNIGIYGGYNFGRYRVRMEGGSVTELAPISFSVGGFFNVGALTIDTNSTTLADAPLAKEEKASIGILSPGIGAMISLHNLQIGLYTGIDFGIGRSGRKWNYNNAPWIGFGLAYSVSSFWKK